MKLALECPARCLMIPALTFLPMRVVLCSPLRSWNQMGGTAALLAQGLERSLGYVASMQRLAVRLGKDKVPIAPVLAVPVHTLAVLLTETPLQPLLDLPLPQSPESLSKPAMD